METIENTDKNSRAEKYNDRKKIRKQGADEKNSELEYTAIEII